MIHRKTLIRLGIILALMLTVAGASFAQTRDSDGDGVSDAEDRCPRQAGSPNNAGCPISRDTNNNGGNQNNNNSDNNSSSDVPPPDTDGDGTADPQDRCPNQQGDGANYGCPEGQTSEDQPEADTASGTPYNPQPISDDDDCSLATADNYRVNMRQAPDPNSPVVNALSPNEIFVISGVYYPDSTDTNDVWYLIIPETGASGWVHRSVIRFGGADCDVFEVPVNRAGGDPYATFKFRVVWDSHSSADGDVDGRDFLVWQRGFGNGFPIEIDAFAATNETHDVVPTDQVSLNFGKIEFEYKPQSSNAGNGMNAFLRLDGLEGEIEPTDNDDGSTTVEYCVDMEVQEAGVFEEVCYQIEVPENCTLTSTEVGVYKIDCEGEAVIEINPTLDGLPAADITIPEDNQAILIGLLLPAVEGA